MNSDKNLYDNLTEETILDLIQFSPPNLQEFFDKASFQNITYKFGKLKHPRMSFYLHE